MFDLTQFALYFAACLLLAITPGPGLFYVAARTLAGGRSDGVASSFGTAVGGMMHVIAGAVGVSAIVLASAELFTALKYAGAAYLVWLGIRTIVSARADGNLAATSKTGVPVKAKSPFREGMVVEALNPKTAAFFLAFIPQFVVVEAGWVAAQFFVLGVVSVALNTFADIAVAFAAGRVRQTASSRPKTVGVLRQVSGGAMIALGIGLTLARRPAA